MSLHVLPLSVRFLPLSKHMQFIQTETLPVSVNVFVCLCLRSPCDGEATCPVHVGIDSSPAWPRQDERQCDWSKQTPRYFVMKCNFNTECRNSAIMSGSVCFCTAQLVKPFRVIIHRHTRTALSHYGFEYIYSFHSTTFYSHYTGNRFFHVSVSAKQHANYAYQSSAVFTVSLLAAFHELFFSFSVSNEWVCVCLMSSCTSDPLCQPSGADKHLQLTSV